jgi:CheY-like chemotaxis protein
MIRRPPRSTQPTTLFPYTTLFRSVEDGATTLEVVGSDAGGFDLLVSDIKMPVMDGIALALNVARDKPNLPILLMTGYADQRERAHGLDQIVRDVVLKPFTLADIRRVVAATLAEGSGEPTRLAG